ncbi:MAG TPA: ATP-binding protein [Chitinophagaceae bacterium]|jgi:PAS domain S-box-containing protein|nr:ATP-binding protein [Chitinophagaceae bacterium]
MHELARVTLQNEMDLILAHKRSMRLGELAGLSLSAQTTFATAVSEVSRHAIESEKGGSLILSVEGDSPEKYIVACLQNEKVSNNKENEGLQYAKKLVNRYNISANGNQTSIELFYHIAPSFRIDIHKLDEWRSMFRNERPISAYEELKRKNEQLQDLSEKVQKSEAQYKTLTNSLPIIIFSLDAHGQILYANEWLSKFTGETIEALNKSRWKRVVHEADYDSFLLLFENPATKGTSIIKTQARLKHRSGDNYLWHQVSLSQAKNTSEDLQYWIGYIVDIHAQKVVEETLQDNVELKKTQQQLRDNQLALERYIAELAHSNQELQQFAFIASHDLQEPVRKLLFYSDYLLSQYTGCIDQKGIDFLTSMQAASQRMRSLIQDLLSFSLINKEQIKFTAVDLNTIVSEARQDLEMSIEEKGAVLNVQSLPTVTGDARMLRQLFENIISNSLKYARATYAPVIDISYEERGEYYEFAFKDNGIGFNEQYLPQMFTLFQRLHDRKTYEGTGLGLAICRKIVDVHGGEIRAEGQEGEGATFYISLPIIQQGN